MVGKLSLNDCNEKCLAVEGCTSISHGKNQRDKECWLGYGQDGTQTSHSDFDVYVFTRGISFMYELLDRSK